MKNYWMKNFIGIIKVRLVGKEAERLINQLIRKKISLFQLQRINQEELTFHLLLKDLPILRNEVRQFSVKIYFLDRKGFPFLLKKIRKQMGLVIGIFMFLLIITILSNMVWHIEIVGAKPETEYKILNQLKKMGVAKWQFQFFIDNPETIQRKIIEANDEITWVGVQLNGTTYHIQVVEKEQPEKPKETGPQHLVASKEAVIVDMYIEKGQKLVSVNDFVRPGQLLVSGLMGDGEKKQFVSAKGVVLGKTWYKTTTEVKLNSEYSLLSGKEMSKHSIKFWNVSIPIWGFKKDNYQNKKIEKEVKNIKFFKWTLPISYVKTTIREVEKHKKTYQVEEALQMAKELAKKDILSYLPNDAKIVSENVLQEKIENGTLKLTIIYDVVENIAKEQPIQ